MLIDLYDSNFKAKTLYLHKIKIVQTKNIWVIAKTMDNMDNITKMLKELDRNKQRGN